MPIKNSLCSQNELPLKKSSEQNLIIILYLPLLILFFTISGK